MSTTVPNSAAPGDPSASVPEGLVAAVVDLVGTGAVLLGAYTLAELTAVDAIVDFLETPPSDEVLAEAVRSLVARELLVAADDGGQVQVRGDMGIALAFQQRARMVLDARLTGSVPGEPWRTLLLPQPEQIVLEIRIDALGVHAISLRTTAEAADRLAKWLPSGDSADADDATTADAVLASADRSALVSVTGYSSEGTAETAGETSDTVLASSRGTLHTFVRASEGSADLVRQSLTSDNVEDWVVSLLSASTAR